MNKKNIVILIIGLILGIGIVLATTTPIPEQKPKLLPLEEFMQMNKEQLIEYKNKINAELKLMECLESPAYFAFKNPEVFNIKLQKNPCEKR